MRATLLFAALLMSACVQRPVLEPAAEATRIPGARAGAMDVAADVQVEVRAERWEGEPLRMDAVMPLMVRIVNQSERPLLLRYQDMQLHGGTGMTYLALPPYDLESREIRQAVSRYPARGFQVAPHLAPWYADAQPWGEPLAWDRMYHSRHHSTLARADLPLMDLIDRALPEGVLQPGGEISGYVYMQPLGASEQGVLFDLALIDARTGLSFGNARIPFYVRMRPST